MRGEGKREAFPGMYAPDRLKVPVGEHGHLTPIRPTAGDRSIWLWKCRCGGDVTRQAKAVRKAVAAGRSPKCDACAKAERAEQVGA